MVTNKAVGSRGRVTQVWVAALAVSLIGRIGWAQPAGDMPPAEKVLDRYVEVTGGEAAYKKLRNQVMEGAFEIPAQGLKFTMMAKSAAPDKLVVEMKSETMGTIVKGTDGEAAWEINQMMGPRLVEGPELAEFKRQATFNAPLHWRKLYDNVENLGLEDVDGKPAYKLQLTPKEGKPETQYFDKESGLLLKQDTINATQMGEIPITTTFSEYKEFDGIKTPTATKQSFAGIEVLITLSKLENNVELAEDAFEMPAEVKELQDGGSDEKEAEGMGEEPAGE